MNIYVAGSWSNRTECGRCIHLLRDMGHDVFDWTELGWSKASDMEKYAKTEIRKVMECDLFVIVDPCNCSHGKMIELGVAIAMKKRIITVASKWYGIFTYLGRSMAHAKTIEDLVHLMDGMFPEIRQRTSVYPHDGPNWRRFA